MNTPIASIINQKIKTLPENLLQEVDNYIDFLKFKSLNSDWSEQLSQSQIALVEKGKKDIEEGRVFPHNDAKQKIKEYIKSKSV